MPPHIVRNIKIGERTKVDLISESDEMKVVKKYHQRYGPIFSAEIKNLKIVRDSQFQKAIDIESYNRETRELVFPYIPHTDCKEILTKTKKQKNFLELIVSTMVEEMHTFGEKNEFPFIPDGLREKNDSRTYSQMLINDNLDSKLKLTTKNRNSIRKLLNSTPSHVISGRYDPELTNFLYVDDAIKTIDYALMIKQEIGYPFAYAAIHLKKDFEVDGIINKDLSELFLGVSKELMGNQLKYNTKIISNQLLLSCVEVLGYLNLEYQEYAKSRPLEKQKLLEKANWTIKCISEYLN